MSTESIRLIVSGFVIVFGTIFPAIAIAIIGKQALESLGRNPEAEAALRTSMILAIAFAEAVAIYALVISLIIKFA